MTASMTITDEMLMAYVDGEMNAEARAAVEAAMARDPAIASQIERHRALRNKLHAAFDGVLQEPVPDRLIATALNAPAKAHRASVTDFAQVRAAKAAAGSKRRWSWPEWSAMAASLLVGLLLGLGSLLPTSNSPVATQDGRLVARGNLARALSNQIAGEGAPSSPVRIALSFRDRSGDYCRTFSLQNDAGLAGLACHENDAWRIQLLTASESEKADGTGYRMAGTELPQSVLKAVEQQIVGEPLDAAGEAAARQKNWR